MEAAFKGKRILVTGAGRGIGRSIAIKLSLAGANVVAISRTKSNLDSLQAECPNMATVQLDMADFARTREVVEGLPVFDGLVNNAAAVIPEPFLDATPDSFDKTFEVNVKAVLNISQVVAKKMIENNIHGSIVNISSQVSKGALQDYALYSASKAALDALTRAMAVELGPHGIRTNTVNPTVVLTARGREVWSDADKANKMMAKIPLRRFAEVSEVVDVVTFLLSDQASMINGAQLPIDGGYLAA